jgi:hypothetical protein
MTNFRSSLHPSSRRTPGSSKALPCEQRFPDFSYSMDPCSRRYHMHISRGPRFCPRPASEAQRGEGRGPPRSGGKGEGQWAAQCCFVCLIEESNPTPRKPLTLPLLRNGSLPLPAEAGRGEGCSNPDTMCESDSGESRDPLNFLRMISTAGMALIQWIAALAGMTERGRVGDDTSLHDCECR